MELGKGGRADLGALNSRLGLCNGAYPGELHCDVGFFGACCTHALGRVGSGVLVSVIKSGAKWSQSWLGDCCCKVSLAAHWPNPVQCVSDHWNVGQGVQRFCCAVLHARIEWCGCA